MTTLKTVKCTHVGTWDAANRYLTLGNNYTVVEETHHQYRLQDVYYQWGKWRFEIVAVEELPICLD